MPGTVNDPRAEVLKMMPQLEPPNNLNNPNKIMTAPVTLTKPFAQDRNGTAPVGDA